MNPSPPKKKEKKIIWHEKDKVKKSQFKHFSTRRCGTRNTKSARSKCARRFTRSSVRRELRDCASPQPGRSAPPTTSRSAAPSTRTSASRSSGPSMSLTLSPNARLSTNRTASTSGGVMATTRCGLPSREPARTFPTTSAGTWRRPTPGRSPTRSATTSPSRGACPSPSRPASPCPTRSARPSLTECQDVPRQQCHSEHKRFPVRISRQAPKKVCDEVHSTAPLAAAAVHQAPVHHQASPSVQDLLNYGVPAVPTQTVPQIIDARDKQRLQSAAKDDRIVFA